MCKDHGLGSNCLMGAQSGLCFKYGKQINTLTHQLFCVCVWGGDVYQQPLFLCSYGRPPMGAIAALPADCRMALVKA